MRSRSRAGQPGEFAARSPRDPQLVEPLGFLRQRQCAARPGLFDLRSQNYTTGFHDVAQPMSWAKLVVFANCRLRECEKRSSERIADLDVVDVTRRARPLCYPIHDR